jgi:Ca-activated chloride channel family protein
LAPALTAAPAPESAPAESGRLERKEEAEGRGFRAGGDAIKGVSGPAGIPEQRRSAAKAGEGQDAERFSRDPADYSLKSGAAVKPDVAGGEGGGPGGGEPAAPAAAAPGANQPFADHLRAATYYDISAAAKSPVIMRGLYASGPTGRRSPAPVPGSTSGERAARETNGRDQVAQAAQQLAADDVAVVLEEKVQPANEMPAAAGGLAAARGEATYARTLDKLEKLEARAELVKSPARPDGTKDGRAALRADVQDKLLAEAADELNSVDGLVDAVRQKTADMPANGKQMQMARQMAQAEQVAVKNNLDADAVAELPMLAKRLAASEPVPAKKPRPQALAVNPFVSVDENRFSTFGIDVDTASYTLTRQALFAGQLPDPDQVRTEEIVNFFDYGDAAPDRTMFRVYVEGAPSAFNPGKTLLRIGVKGRRLGREEQRPAVLTFLIDTSGSMSQPDRIGRARTALRLLLDNLSPADRIQIVAFDDRARLILPPTSAREKKAVLAAFDRLQCNGSTNLEDGMRKAYQQAAAAFVPGAENRVILLSDGVANLGADSAQDILRQVESSRKQGITCTVFGVGSGTYNDALLLELADKGDGMYRFLDTDEEARRVFVDDLAATLNTIARDVKIQVEWNAAAVRQYRQLGYEKRALTAQQFRDDTVDAGEVGSGQSVTALYELDLAPRPRHATPDTRHLPLGTVRVRYRCTDTMAVEEIEQPIAAEIVAASLAQARPQLRLAACAAGFAELLRGSPYLPGKRYEDVARLLRPVSLELSLDGRVKELLSLVEAAGALSK